MITCQSLTVLRGKNNVAFEDSFMLKTDEKSCGFKTVQARDTSFVTYHHVYCHGQINLATALFESRKENYNGTLEKLNQVQL